MLAQHCIRHNSSRVTFRVCIPDFVSTEVIGADRAVCLKTADHMRAAEDPKKCTRRRDVILTRSRQGLKKPLFCVLRDELVRVKDELLTEEGRVVIYSLY